MSTFGPFDDFHCVETMRLLIVSSKDFGVSSLAERLIESNNVVIDFFPSFVFAHSDTTEPLYPPK